MKWYQTWDYKTRKPFWWTQRDERGVCFEIRKNGEHLDLFLGEHEKRISRHNTLQEAMNAALAF